ncbi:MAG: flagellar hook-basal body complex protein FliE [Candidatus Sericytochromatia bacterium]
MTQPQMALTFEIPKDEITAKRSSFTEVLNSAIEETNQAERESESMMTDLLLGKDVDIHAIQVAGAKLDTMVTMASTVMTKLTTAYQTLMNMQV